MYAKSFLLIEQREREREREKERREQRVQCVRAHNCRLKFIFFLAAVDICFISQCYSYEYHWYLDFSLSIE